MKPRSKTTSNLRLNHAEADGSLQRNAHTQRTARKLSGRGLLTRVAAHRYREKRRAATNALEERVKELEAEKRSLNATIGTLHSALLSLSEEASRHSVCGAERIL
jgi:hypothetical protein